MPRFIPIVVRKRVASGPVIQSSGDTDINYVESMALGDVLSGQLGPFNAQESVEVLDALATRLDPGDSVDWGDLILPMSMSGTGARADSMDVADAQGGVSGLGLTVDSLGIDDKPALGPITGDSLDVSDHRSSVSFSGVLWPNAQVSNTGWASPSNMTDTNTGTAATASATSSGVAGTGGTQNSTSADLIVSCGDMNLSDWNISSVVLDWVIQSTGTGIFSSPGQCNINYQYSLNDGASWVTFFAQTAMNSSTGSLSLGSLTPTQLNQLRFRGVGTVLSGTGLLPVTTTASWHFTRATITASKTY